MTELICARQVTVNQRTFSKEFKALRLSPRRLEDVDVLSRRFSLMEERLVCRSTSRQLPPQLNPDAAVGV
jgi:hypothetical protein